MPYSIPKPIPQKNPGNSTGGRDRDSSKQSIDSERRNSAANPVGVSFSPVKRAQVPIQTQQGSRRRRSLTIKTALSSLLGSSPPQHNPSSNQFSSSVRRNRSSLSVAESSNSATNHSTLAPKLRSYSSTTADSISMSYRTSGNYAGNEDDEEAVVESLNDDTSLDDDSTMAASTNRSSMSNPGQTNQTLKSLGKVYLSEYLSERGLLPPTTVLENQSLRLSLATSGDSVFLPTISTTDDEYLARLNGLRGDEEELQDIDDRQDGVSNNEEDIRGRAESRGRDSSSTPVGLEPHASGNNLNTSEGRVAEDSGSNHSAESAFEIDSSMATYTVAVILSIFQPTTLSDIKTEVCSRIRVYWPNGVPPTKSFHEEFYCAGNISWDLDSDNVNLFVPANVSSTARIVNNKTNLEPLKVFQNSADARKRYLDKSAAKKQLLNKIKPSKSHVYQTGDYVFVIPIVFLNSIPESLYLPSARVNYRFRVGMKIIDPQAQQENLQTQQENLSLKNAENEMSSKKFTIFKKLKNNLHLTNQHSNKEEYDDTNDLYLEYPINVIRTPPQYSISTANKPVYINRVWSDSLSYEISFAQKYVSLGSKVPIRLKIVPLVKNICLKRIRISVVEKITLVSKNFEYEYDQIDPVAKDPYNPYFAEFASKRKKERNVSLLEIRTKDKGSRAIREEVVTNCLEDNLLAYAPLRGDDGEEVSGLTEPLIVTTNLEFPKYIDMDKEAAKVIPPYGIDIYGPILNPELSKNTNPNNRGGVIGFLAGRRSSLSGSTKSAGPSSQSTVSQSSFDSRFHETNFKSDSGVPIEFQTRLNKAKRGLYLDSLHFTNIYSRHKLEIMLRISKSDVKDPSRLRHYEVLIDTPIFLVSDLCNSGNMELPTYDMATNDRFSHEMVAGMAPPTFEEAISVPGSPLNSPMMSPLLMGAETRMSSEPDDLFMNNLSLSRSASISASSPLDGAAAGGVPMNISASVDGNQRYNNLDGLLSPSVHANNVTPAPNSFTSNFNNIVEEKEASAVRKNSLFKADYSISKGATQLENQGPDFGVGVESSATGHVPISGEPPRYDDIVQKKSDKK